MTRLHTETPALRPSSIAMVAVALFLLLAITMALASLGLGSWALPLALVIACAKTILVAGWFMDFRRAPSTIRLTAVIALLLFAFLLAGALADARTRPSALSDQPPGHVRQSAASTSPGLARP